MEDDPITRLRKAKILYIDNKFKVHEIADKHNIVLETKFIETKNEENKER